MENEKVIIKESGLKYSTAGLLGLFVLALGIAIGYGLFRKYSPCISLPVLSIERDTVTIRDTINGVPQKPTTERLLKFDTARINLKPTGDGKFKIDTVTPPTDTNNSLQPRITPSGGIAIPISQKVYETEDYRAVVSGYKPSLDSMAVYRKTSTITETRTVQKTKRPWLALTLNGGLAYAGKDAPIQAFGVGIRPTVGVGLGIVIKSW